MSDSGVFIACLLDLIRARIYKHATRDIEHSDCERGLNVTIRLVF